MWWDTLIHLFKCDEVLWIYLFKCDEILWIHLFKCDEVLWIYLFKCDEVLGVRLSVIEDYEDAGRQNIVHDGVVQGCGSGLLRRREVRLTTDGKLARQYSTLVYVLVSLHVGHWVGGAGGVGELLGKVNTLTVGHGCVRKIKDRQNVKHYILTKVFIGEFTRNR